MKGYTNEIIYSTTIQSSIKDPESLEYIPIILGLVKDEFEKYWLVCSERGDPLKWIIHKNLDYYYEDSSYGRRNNYYDIDRLGKPTSYENLIERIRRCSLLSMRKTIPHQKVQYKRIADWIRLKRFIL